MMLNIKEVQAIENKRKQIKKDTYKKIYDELTRKIRNAVSVGHKQTVLHVPRYIFGYPTYDLSHVTRYMIRQFSHSGFTCGELSPGEIYVSWKKEKTKKTEETPPPEEEDFPTFVNLKKVANKLRKQ